MPQDPQSRVRREDTPDAFVGALLPTMFSKTMPRETVDDFRASMQAFHPRGFRAMARASAEDVRDVLSRVDVPTLLVYGDRDVRAPLTVAEALQAGRPAAAGIDVFAQEPPPADHPLLRLPNVVVTPHCAAGTVQVQHAKAQAITANVRRLLDGEELLYRVR
jgi:pimeloyl-ACP methyl ester carboxylesterase